MDWIADSEDKMLSLAFMNGGINYYKFQSLLLHQFYEGKLYLFHFTSDPLINQNQTFIVDTTTNTSNSSAIGFKGNSNLKSLISF